jgi:hypothetical protein
MGVQRPEVWRDLWEMFRMADSDNTSLISLEICLFYSLLWCPFLASSIVVLWPLVHSLCHNAPGATELRGCNKMVNAVSCWTVQHGTCCAQKSRGTHEMSSPATLTTEQLLLGHNYRMSIPITQSIFALTLSSLACFTWGPVWAEQPAAKAQFEREQSLIHCWGCVSPEDYIHPVSAAKTHRIIVKILKVIISKEA